MNQPPKVSLGYIIKIIIMLFILSILITFSISLFIEAEPVGNVAEIPIRGFIAVEDYSGFGREASSSEDVIELIEKASKNPSIKAILLNINSGGYIMLFKYEGLMRGRFCD